MAKSSARLACLIRRTHRAFGSALNVVRQAIQARTPSALARQVVFVPELGFRPPFTRVLLERARATVDGTSVSIIAVAAGVDRTDLLIEWEPPEHEGGWLLRIDREGVEHAPSPQLDVSLIVGGDTHAPLHVENQLASANGYRLCQLTFPGVGASADESEVLMVAGADRWRVPFRLASADFLGRAALAETEQEGITLRATAVARRGRVVAIALEATTTEPGVRVCQIGSAGPWGFRRQLKTSPGLGINYPITLRDDRGRRSDEFRRLRHYSRDGDWSSLDPWPNRITSVFDAVDRNAKSAVLTVPSILIVEQASPIVVDLRALPTEVDLGAHRLQVLRVQASPDAPGQHRIVFQFPKPYDSRRLLGPATLLAHGMPNDISIRGQLDERQQVWMDTIIPSLPVVTLTDAIVRIEEPWLLRVPLM